MDFKIKVYRYQASRFIWVAIQFSMEYGEEK
jgi:hypothetical protein